MEFHQGQELISSLLLSFHQILACQWSIGRLLGLFVRSQEWSHTRDAVLHQYATQRCGPNMYTTSYLTRPRHQAGVLLPL